MSFPTTFFNLPAGPNSAALLDAMFAILGQSGIIPSNATAVANAITLTPNSNFYSPTSYANNQSVVFTAPATSTGPVTAAFPGLGFVKVFTPSGIQAGSGDIVINSNYLMVFFANLDGGNGGFLIINSQLPSIAQPTAGSFKNLKLTNTTSGTPNSQVTPTADELVLENASGGTVRLTSFAPAVTNILSTGANGLDTGAVAAATWYAWWAIYNPTTATAAGLLSTSFTNPTLPAGFTYKARFGAFITDGSSNLHRVLQLGRNAQYVIQTSGPTLLPPVMASGTAGTYSTTNPVLASVSTTAFVPPTASKIRISFYNAWKGGSSVSALLAPNVNWGGTANGPAGTNGVIWPGTLTSAVVVGITVEMLLEAASVAWCAQASAAAFASLGWEDNI